MESKNSSIRKYQILNIRVLEVLLPVILGILVVCLMVYSLKLAFAFGLLLPALYIITKKPAFGLLVILTLISSIVFKEALPVIPLGVGSLYIPDIILIYLLFLTIVSRGRAGRLFSDYGAGEKILFCFFIASIIALLNAVMVHKVPLVDAAGEFRILTYYLLYPVIAELFQSEKQIRYLVNGMFVLGLVVGGAMLIQAVIGESIHLMPGRIEAAEAGYYPDSATRILPPGQALVLFIFIVSGAILYLADRFNKIFVYLSFFVCAVGVLLTYNRSYWVAGFICFIILFAMAKTNRKIRIFSRLFFPSIMVLFFVLMFFLVSPSRFASRYLKTIEDRVESLFSLNELYSSGSLQWRVKENSDAVESIKNNPILGIGLANKYRNIRDPSLKLLETYVHNGYLWVLIKMGILGFLPFVSFFLWFLYESLKSLFELEPGYLRSVHVGISLFILAVMAINFVNPMFMQWMSLVVIVISMGIANVVKRIEYQTFFLTYQEDDLKKQLNLCEKC